MIKRISKALKSKATVVSAKYIRRLRNPEKYKSLEFFCDYLKDENIRLNKEGEANKKKIITELCTLDSVAGYESFHFPKGCACLVATEKDGVAAIKRGAVILITQKEFKNLPCLICDNTLAVFAKWCKYYRDLQKRVSVVAVSGSIGKTTVKNMIADVLKMKYETTYTHDNWNTRMSVGFAVQHIPNHAERMIQEIHEGNPNETQYISEMLHPDVFVMTPIDKSHMSRFGSENAIVEEVCSISRYMSEKGTVIVNADEFDQFDLLNNRKIITVSTKSRNADFSASNIVVKTDGLEFSVYVKQQEKTYQVLLKNIYAPHNVDCAMYAFALGFIDGLEPEKIIQGLSNYRTDGVRQNIIRTNDDILLYADCFNAIGRSMKSAIDACDLIPVKGKRVAVLGNIEEAGEMSEEMHKEVVGYVNDSKFDVLMSYGEKMNAASNSAEVRESLVIKTYDQLDLLAKAILNSVKGGDLVLFKGSHSCNLDKCILKCWPYLEDIVVPKDNWITNCLFY